MQEAIRHGGRADGRPTREEIEPAARSLVERHGVQLIATARRYSLTAEDAEDAYQRGLEILLTKAPSVQEDDLVPWLKTVVKHEAFAIRKQRQRAELAAEPDLLGALALPAHEQAERQERLRVGVEAMSRLKPQELRCLLLRADGYSYRQICDETGWTYTKVNRCITEGRKAFAKRLAGIESGAECERLAPLLSRLVDGEATAEDVATLRPHLRSCLGCRATLREFRDAPARAAAFAPVLLSPHLLGRALRRLRDMFRFFGAHKTAAVIGMVAVVAAGGAAVRGVGHPAPPRSERIAQRPSLPRSAHLSGTPRRTPTSHHVHRKRPKRLRQVVHRSGRPVDPASPATTTTAAGPVARPTPTPAPRPKAPTSPRPTAATGGEFGP